MLRSSGSELRIHFVLSRLDNSSLSSRVGLFHHIVRNVRQNPFLSFGSIKSSCPFHIVFFTKREACRVKDIDLITAGHACSNQVLKIVTQFFSIIDDPVPILSVQKILFLKVGT